MHRELGLAIEGALGARIARASAVSGGDVNEALRVELGDGRRVFVKTNARADAGMFEAEARALAWIGEGELRVPRVLACSGADAAPEARFLALEWIERGAPARGAGAALGRGLARLHALGAPAFGLARESWLATIRWDAVREPDWPAFYGRCRIEPLLAAARERGASSRSLDRAVERVLAELPRLCGPPEPPARLHGDLWAGNAMHDERGAPVLIDPAAYGGHREIDLAMMRLFGGFGADVFDAYEATSRQEGRPLAPGHEARVPLYQLLPLLAHAVLFGGSWAAAAERAAGAALSAV